MDLPLRPPEAAEVANLIFEQAERKPLTDEVRNRVAARGAVLRLESMTPWYGSLERDPVHPSSYYLAVDGAQGEPLLLHLATAAAPTSSIFCKALLIGRMRRPNGPEMVINTIPFGPSDYERIDQFATRINPAFLPRPQGSRPAIAVETDEPEKALPAAFDAFRSILKRTGKNLAGTSVPQGPDEDLPRKVYFAGIWAAIRAGWREGYSAGVGITAEGTLEAAREAIRKAAAFTRFSIDITPLVYDAGAAEEDFERTFTAEERGWIFDEFARPFDMGGTVYEFAPEDVVRLALKFGRGLQAAGRLHEAIRQARAVRKTGRPFDFELSLNSASQPVAPGELMFCLHWLKASGHAAQLAAGGIACLPELAAVCRHYQCTLSVRGRGDCEAETLDAIGRATGGRVNYVISGGADAGGIAAAADRLLG